MPPRDNTVSGLRLAGAITGCLFAAILGLVVLSALMPGHGLSALFSGVCHQQAERSHQIGGVTMAVCIRCFWLYLGLLVGHGRFVLFPGIPRYRLGLLITALSLAGWSWVSGWFGVTVGEPGLRMISGLLLGVAIAHFSVPGVAELCLSFRNRNTNHNPYYGTSRT